MSQEDNILSQETIKELMRALGFHQIPSRARWKMKITDTIEITDAMIREANQQGKLADFLSKFLEDKFQGLKNVLSRKKILNAFFKT